MADTTDWSQFTPVNAAPAASAPPAVDWSQFTPVTQDASDSPMAAATARMGNFRGMQSNAPAAAPVPIVYNPTVEKLRADGASPSAQTHATDLTRQRLADLGDNAPVSEPLLIAQQSVAEANHPGASRFDPIATAYQAGLMDAARRDPLNQLADTIDQARFNVGDTGQYPSLAQPAADKNAATVGGTLASLQLPDQPAWQSNPYSEAALAYMSSFANATPVGTALKFLPESDAPLTPAEQSVLAAQANSPVMSTVGNLTGLLSTAAATGPALSAVGRALGIGAPRFLGAVSDAAAQGGLRGRIATGLGNVAHALPGGAVSLGAPMAAENMQVARGRGASPLAQAGAGLEGGIVGTLEGALPVALGTGRVVRGLTGAAIGAGTNEINNAMLGQPAGTGDTTAALFGAGMGALMGKPTPFGFEATHGAVVRDADGRVVARGVGSTLRNENGMEILPPAQLQARMDFLKTSVAKQDFDERMAAVAGHVGGEVPPAYALNLAAQVAGEHGVNVADLVNAPAGPLEGGAAAADAALNEARQTVNAATPDIPATPAAVKQTEATPPAVSEAPIAPDLAPRAPALPEVPPNVIRDDLVQQWRDARTDGEKQTAAGRIAAFDQQAQQAAAAPNVPDIPEYPNLNQDQREVETRARDQVLADPEAALRAYQALPGTENGRIISVDEAREIFPDYNAGPDARSTNAPAVHEPASFVAKSAWKQALAKPRTGEQAFVLFTGGGTGAGKTSGMRMVPGLKALREHADIVYDGNLQNEDSAVKKIDDALKSKRKVKIVYTFRDPAQAYVHGVLPRAERTSYGRTVSVPAHVSTHTGAAETYLALKQRYADNPNVTVDAIYNNYDPRTGTSEVSPLHDDSIPAQIASRDRDTMAAEIRDAFESERQAGRVSDRVYHGTLGTAHDRSQPQGGDGRVGPGNEVGQTAALADRSGNDRSGVGPGNRLPVGEGGSSASGGLESTQRPSGEPQHQVTPPEGGVSGSGEAHASTDNPIVELPLADLKLSDDVPQFKGGANADTGVVEPLGGTFDRRGTGPIQVWRRNDGRLEVISGRHRLDLARRSGEQTIPAQVYDESSGFDARQAASLDAELNIRDGQGKVADYVQYFQRPAFEGHQGRQAAESRGLLARATGRRAYALAGSGSTELIAAHRAGQLSDETAVQIAQAAPGNDRLQALGMKLTGEGRSITQAVNTMHAVRSMGGERVQNGDMFGFDDSAIREAEAMAKAAAGRQRELGERLTAITGAAKRPELARREGIDVHNPEAITRRIGELRAERDAWNNWATDPDKVAQVREEAGLKPSPERAPPPEEPAPPVDDRTGTMFSRDANDRATSDLFGTPTQRERIAAAERAKDAQRNGQTGGRKDAGDGGLFDGQRPEQTDLAAPRRSQGEPGTARFDVTQVRDAAAKAWGNRFLKKLERAGRLEFLTSDELLARRDSKGKRIVSRGDLEGTKGVYHGKDGKAYIVTDHIRDLKDVAGTVLHEAGLHYGYDRLTKPEDRLRLRNMVNRALAMGDPAMVRAWRHAEAVGTPAKDLHEEAMAYLVENDPGHGIVTRVIDAIKRGLNRAGVPMDLLQSDSDAIRMMARDSLRRAAGGEKAGLAKIDAEDAQDFRASTVHGQPVFSRYAETREAYDKRIDELFDGDKPRLAGTRVLDRSDVVALMGHGEGPVNLAERKVAEGQFNHGLTAKDWKQIPEWLDNPVAVFDSETRDGRLVFIAPERVGGHPVLMIVEPNAKGGSDVHLLVNAYDKTSHLPLDRWLRDQRLRYLDQSQVDAWNGQKNGQSEGRTFQTRLSGLPAAETGLRNPSGERSWLRLPRDVRQLRGYRHRVLTEQDLVNYRVQHPFDAENDMRYSRDLPDERDLIAQHNTTAEKLAHADRMGGFAVPSIGITRSEHPLEGFGDITLLGDKDLVNPRAGAKVFGADAYTPRYPDVTYRLDRAAAQRVAKIIGQRAGDRTELSADAKPDDLIHSDAFKRYVEEKLGTGWNFHEARALAEDVLREAGAKEVLFKGYTNAGYRRYAPHTLENVVRELKRNLRGGESWDYGPGSIRAKFTPQFRSIETIRAEKGRLVSKADFENLREDVNKGFFDVERELAPFHKHGGTMEFTDVVTEAMKDAAKMGIDRALRENGFTDVSPDARAKLAEYLTHLKNMPTEYFEAVLPRAVGIGEFRAAVVPQDTSAETRALLEGKGIKVHEYDKSVPGDRARAIDDAAKAEDIRFSRDLLGDEDSQAAQARREAAAMRGSVLNKLAAEGYPRGAVGWTGNPNSYEGFHDGAQRLVAGLVDRYDPIKRMQVAITGGDVNAVGDMANVYRLENLMHGRTGDRLARLDRDDVKPMIKSMRQMKVSSDLLNDYLLARHAPERNARIASINKEMPDGGSGITTEQAKAFMAGDAEGVYSSQKLTPALREKVEMLAKRVDKMHAETLNTLERSGQITPQLAAQMRKAYKYYVPLRGKGSDVEGAAQPSSGGFGGRGIDIKGKPVRRALGRGDGNLAPPHILGEMIGDAQRAIVQAEKARVGRALLRLALEHPNPAVWQVEPVDLEWKFSESTGEAYLGTKKPTNDQNVLTVVHNGTPYHVRLVDTRLQEAVMNMDTRSAEFMVHWIGKMNRWLSAAFTRFNPAFMPINMTRDLLLGSVGMAAEHGVGQSASTLKHYLPAMRAAWRDFGGKHVGDASVPDAQKTMDDWAREYGEAGGKTGIAMAENPDVIAKNLADSVKTGLEILGETTLHPMSWGKPVQAVGRALGYLKPVVDVVERANDATENAMRLASYVARRKAGASPEAAADYAKNITVNFNRKGRWGPVLNSLFLFYNASLQGSRRIYQLVKDHPAGMTAFLGSLAALQAQQATVLMSRKGQDGISDWDAIPDYKKSTALIIALPGKGHYFALPMPYEFGFVTYAGGRMAQHVIEHDPTQKHDSVAADLAVGFLHSFSPVPLEQGLTGLVPAPLQAFMDVRANKDDMGREITFGEDPNGYAKPQSSLGRPGVPAPYVWLSRTLNKIGGGDPDWRPPPLAPSITDVSPDSLQYLANFFMGGLGSFVSGSWRTAESSLAGIYTDKKDGQTAVDWTKLASEMPILSRFGIQTNVNRARSDRFYNIRDEMDRTKAMIQAKIDHEDFAGAQQVAKDAGIFGDGWTIGMNRNGTPSTSVHAVDGQQKRTLTLAAIPGTMAGAYQEAEYGINVRRGGQSYLVQPGVRDFNRMIHADMGLSGVQRQQSVKQLQDQRGGLMGAFLNFYEHRQTQLDPNANR